ncbi:MAG: hypothetical protein HZB19_12630 [Chloroflexi bacterium]|nr:hypothetical protein [Chloroflexota bacterium]
MASESQAFKDLFISFLTIKRYRDLLFDPMVHLRNDITPEFINKVMIPDFGIVILKLRDYDGRDRRGVQQSYGLMDVALRELYSAHNEKGLVDAAMDCRNKLHTAYQQLEHLRQYLSKLPPVIR